MKKTSAGLIMYRLKDGVIEVFLVHPGGPYWSGKDEGAWSIPKGLCEPGEDLLQAAIREFAEETGFKAGGEFIPLGELKQPSGKVVHAWALESDVEPERLTSNSFTMEWPPRSGRLAEFPEIDRGCWFGMDEARTKILKGQAPFLDRLIQALEG